MRLSVKNTLILGAIASTFMLASCQSQQIDPQPASIHQTTSDSLVVRTYDDQPPKTGGNGGEGYN
ncbi:hypothetical protein [Spirosoma validum]|uniref:Lipoprotein n=1 Tax=Spirosoma validum TaxID=2771355 RepID=A0A927B7W0_9BACT|nr:hypothetical protein [Spirosoma validum]MBD2756903.1 hypothetical protein [Spirosoma validum]